VEDMQDALKDIFGPMFEAMLQGEMNDHLGYEINDHQEKETANRRNGYSSKTLKTSYGDVPIEVPRDRNASFEPKIILKRTTNVSGIEDKALSMYAKGMSQRDIATTIEDIYGFEISHETISDITDCVFTFCHLYLVYWFLFSSCHNKKPPMILFCHRRPLLSLFTEKFSQPHFFSNYNILSIPLQSFIPV